MARKREARTNLIVGIFVCVLAIMAAVSLFIVGQSEGAWESKTTIVTDFNTIGGLRKGSPTQLAGVSIGTVGSIDFVDVQYKCDVESEDRGRHGEGRTDNCDPSLFCAPDEWCADLEQWASKDLHSACASNDMCNEDEICVTKDFRRRYSRVYWGGWDGVCARYFTQHKRVRVTLEIQSNKLDLIRTDSRATVASNGVLGDQLVSITPGMREPVPPGGRIPSTPSLWEDLDRYRERIDSLAQKVDTSLSGISNLFSELNDERTISSIKGTLHNINEVTRQVAEGEGLVGALLHDEQYAKDLSITLRHVRDTAGGLDQFVTRANGTLKKADDNVQPMIDDARSTMESLRGLLGDLKDPKNKSLLSKLIRDDNGQMTADIEKIVADIESIVATIDQGDGTLGKLVNDSKAHDDLVKLLQNLERNRTLKRLTRYIMDMDEKSSAAKPE